MEKSIGKVRLFGLGDKSRMECLTATIELAYGMWPALELQGTWLTKLGWEADTLVEADATGHSIVIRRTDTYGTHPTSTIQETLQGWPIVRFEGRWLREKDWEWGQKVIVDATRKRIDIHRVAGCEDPPMIVHHSPGVYARA